MDKIESYYKDFKKIVKEKKNNLISQLKDKFNLVGNTQIQYFKKFPPELEIKIEKWRKMYNTYKNKSKRKT